MKTLRNIILLCLMMISGNILGQSLLNETQPVNTVERDSIVSKIHAGIQAKEQVEALTTIVKQAETVIEVNKGIITKQDELIVDLKSMLRLSEDNYKLCNKTLINTEKQVKKTKRKGTLKLLQGLLLGTAAGIIIKSI